MIALFSDDFGESLKKHWGHITERFYRGYLEYWLVD
jgi:hypothetical protein